MESTGKVFLSSEELVAAEAQEEIGLKLSRKHYIALKEELLHLDEVIPLSIEDSQAKADKILSLERDLSEGMKASEEFILARQKRLKGFAFSETSADEASKVSKLDTKDLREVRRIRGRLDDLTEKTVELVFRVPEIATLEDAANSDVMMMLDALREEAYHLSLTLEALVNRGLDRISERKRLFKRG